MNRFFIRWNGKTWISYGSWLAAPRDPRFFIQPRILIREITNPRILAAYTEEEFYNTPSIINSTDFRECDPFYLLGVLNSKLMSFYHVETSPKSKKGLFPKILVNDVRCLPIREAPQADQKKIGLIAKRIMSSKERDSSADTSILEREIDQLVYALYGILPEEVGTIESSVERRRADRNA